MKYSALDKWKSGNGIYPMVVAFCLLFSCAPTRLVKPLEKGQQALGGNFGGPLLLLGGTPIPMPLTSAFYAKGISEKTSIFGSLHTTALAFGLFQTDIGVCRELAYIPKHRIGVSANPAINFAIDRWVWNAKIWPQLDLNVYKEWGQGNLFYLGLCNWFEPATKRAHGEKQGKYWFYNPQLGVQFSRNAWTYGLETKWLVPDVKNLPNVPDYIGIQHQGAIGVYFQLMRRF